VTIRAVVFDFDGLILDTETSIYESWCRAFDEHGCAPLTIDEWAAEVGTVRGLDIIDLLEARADRPVNVDAMQERRRAHRDELLAAERARPGVVAWIDDARARGFGVAIASSSEHEWVEAHLTRLGLRDRFAHLACYSETLPAKPAPDTYLEACARLRVAPGDAIALEDSPHGVDAARAAGLRVVAVPNAVTEHMDLSAADLVISSLAECSLADVLARFDA
jgi:HAD superfamily hydrolase (TIGR01509 family)